MIKNLALVAALLVVSAACVTPAEAKRGHDCDRSFRRVNNSWFGGQNWGSHPKWNKRSNWNRRIFRHDNGRHNGWYKNGNSFWF